MNKKQNYINHDNTTLLESIGNFKKDLSKKTIKNYIKNKMVTVNNKVILIIVTYLEIMIRLK